MERRLKSRKDNPYIGYLFLLLPLFFYTLFFIIPNIMALINSFYKWDGIAPEKKFVGFNNFIHMFNDRVFIKALTNTIKYCITLLIFQTGIGLILALLVQKSDKLSSFFRTTYFLPVMMSSVTVGLIWSFIYDPNIGALNETLRALGLEEWTHSWLSDEQIVIYSIAFVHVWVGIGQSVVLFVAGLQNIPVGLYESSSIDGAGKLQQIWYITLPLLKPTVLIVTVLTTIGAFKSFDYVYIMTGGGATHSSEVLATLLYKEAYAYSDFGYSSALSVALLVIVSVLTLIQMKVFSDKGGE